MAKRAAPRSPLWHPRYWLTWLGFGLLWLSAQLPQSLRLFCGHLLGGLLWRFAKHRRHITEVNLRLCFPELDEQAQRRLVRQTLDANATGLLETAWSWWGRQHDWLSRMHLEGRDILQDAQAQGRGVLMLGGHFSNLDLAGQAMGHLVDMDVIYRRAKNPVSDYLILKHRQRVFPHVIERSDMRRVIRSLKQGRVVWYAPDQDYGPQHAVFAPFFGIPAATITAGNRLMAINDSPVVFLSHQREADGRYCLRIEAMPDGFPSGDETADATTMNRVLETAIRRHPEQYMWVHRRFKTRPAGEPAFYRKSR